MILNFSQNFASFNFNSLGAGWVGVGEWIAVFTESGGNLALKSGTNVAQLRLEHHIQGCSSRDYFTKISDSKPKREVQP